MIDTIVSVWLTLIKSVYPLVPCSYRQSSIWRFFPHNASMFNQVLIRTWLQPIEYKNHQIFWSFLIASHYLVIIFYYRKIRPSYEQDITFLSGILPPYKHDLICPITAKWLRSLTHTLSFSSPFHIFLYLIFTFFCYHFSSFQI